MSYTNTTGKTPNLNEPHRSDGSELIPAEVQVDVDREESQSLETPVVTGYTTDDENHINNYAVEPDAYGAEYPSSQQQRRYIFLGVGAILLVLTLILITFTIS